MTQQEFNEMLARAIAGELGGGTYISRWSGEEIDAWKPPHQRRLPAAGEPAGAEGIYECRLCN